MNAELKEMLLKRCRKKVLPSQLCDEEEEWKEAEETFHGLEGESAEELPLEDILAEKRRKYSARDEFIFLFYNDLLPLYIKEWDGQILRKKPLERVFDSFDDMSDEYEGEETEYYVHQNELNNSINSKEYKGESKSSSGMFWKMTFRDEFANITFINNNTYTGRISRKMMEGKGVYRWSNGAQYKGDFEQNLMHGKGLLEWNSDCWYEGDFANGHRHGRGIMVDSENRYMYTGKWYMGQRHGKGYCRDGDNGSYDGDWVMDKMHGIGIRTYAKGTCYHGQWKNGLRNGKGTMVWPNGNVYRGEWKAGAMHGYGEYVWNGFFNKTFTWPQEASYVGLWRNGMRHGKGELKLNTVGGAKYSGFWNKNKKHGYGIIIGNNGEKLESDPLFVNNILSTSTMKNKYLIHELESEDQLMGCVRMVDETKPPEFIENPMELEVAPITPVLKPEQFPSLFYHITRLLNPKSLEEHSQPSITQQKCYSCENTSCMCLQFTPPAIKKKDKNEEEESTSSNPTISTTLESDWKYEEHWVYNCLTSHIARLRQIYDHYARLFTTSAPKCDLAMSRLCLWQLWRDCGIYKKGLNFIEIDDYIKKNKTTFVKDPYHPFEKIEIWQFLHALLEVSWHLYTKVDNIETKEINGKIAGGLHKFLENDIYPYAGKHVGNLCHGYQDLLPMSAVFELYKQTGYPFSAKDLLRTIYISNGTTDPQPFATTTETIQNLSNGINCVTIAERISYLSKFDDAFAQPHCTVEVSNNENDPFMRNTLSDGLTVFKELEITKLLEIVTSVCPAIKDTETDIIVNMDYKLTFLEFYEIILEATKQLLYAKKKLQMTEIRSEDTLPKENDDLQKKENSEASKQASGKKNLKTKNKTA